MESTLLVAIKDDEPEFINQIAWMLGDDAPVFDEDVKPEWINLFKAFEDLPPPDDVLQIGENRMALNWLCADAEEELSAIATVFSVAGINRFAAYTWYDENEAVLLLHNGIRSIIKRPVRCRQTIKSLVKQKMKDWGTAKDREIICILLESLE